MANKDLERVLEENWRNILADIVESTLTVAKIRQKYKVDGQLDAFCEEMTGYKPEDLRISQYEHRIYNRIVDSFESISRIRKEYGVTASGFSQYFIEKYGYEPEQLRIRENIDAIGQELVKGASISQVKSKYHVSSTVLNSVFRDTYGSNATQWMIEERAKKIEYRCRLVAAKGKSTRYSKVSENTYRYRIQPSPVKRLDDADL